MNIFSASPYYYSQVTNLSNYSIKSFLLFITFLPNVALLVYDKFIVGCSQVWSVGIEEQFYIFWPLLIIIFSKKQIIGIFLIIILFFGFTDYSFNPLLKIINKTFPFQYMAIGSLGAVIYKYYKEKVINILQKKLFYYLILVAIFLLLFFDVTNHFYQSLLLSFLFLSLILITINSSFRLLNYPLIVYLGKVSYGIYMYHFLAMYFIIPAANKYLLENLYLYNLVIYILVFLLTIILSHFSYKYFESYILRIKEKKFVQDFR
jgi:peptidoglycan/LPS O-acetylase OafA/YrhL